MVRILIIIIIKHYIIYYILVVVHSTDTVSNTDDIEVREDISSDNQETQEEEVKRKNIDDISTENSITSPDIQEEKCKINNYH